jgi:SAM-dependent methyltransferase
VPSAIRERGFDVPDYSRLTRAVYHSQHARIASDERAMRRYINMFSHEYFGLDEAFFRRAKAPDAGCGDKAKLLIALHRLGCRDIHGFDLGRAFIPVAAASLQARNVRGVTLKSASVLNIPYPDASFDFVACHGVLVHLNDLDEVRRAFRELARVTKPSGWLYTVYGVVGGFWEDCIFPAVRSYYRSNPEFRNLIDTIAPESFGELIDLVERGIEEHEGERLKLDWLKDALDVDLCVTIQNVIQAPVRLRIDQAMIEEMYAEAGFKSPRRLKRYVKRENIRRYFAPLHHAHEHPLVSMIYGSGNLEFIAARDG